MAVIDHPVSDMVRESADAKWGCWNRPERFSEGYYAPDRMYCADGDYEQLHAWIPHVMSHTCRNDISLTDRKCQGCRHIGSGEAYSESVRQAAS
jgi:hypothetical protein